MHMKLEGKNRLEHGCMFMTAHRTLVSEISLHSNSQQDPHHTVHPFVLLRTTQEHYV